MRKTVLNISHKTGFWVYTHSFFLRFYMLLFYSCLMYLLTPYLLLRLWWKGRHLPAYRLRIKERFCLDKVEAFPVDIWLHAVSLGEVIAATPLIEALLAKQYKILVTTMTPTGSQKVSTQFGSRVLHRYVPYDLPWVLKRFFRNFQPRVGVIMETELWPNLIAEAQKAKVNLVLANARLSEKSLKEYLPFKFFFKQVLNQFSNIYAQSDLDMKRFLKLGVHKDRVSNLGNIKFDLQINKVPLAVFHELKNQWGASRKVLIAASTHEGEELMVLDQLKYLQQHIPGIVLLIAPRHPERFQSVYNLAMQQGYKTSLRSQPQDFVRDTEVVVLDSMGELLGFFAVSDYAFVGGSLVSSGGHNVLEPIAMNIPVVSGAFVYNFQTICNELVSAEGLTLVNNAQDLAEFIVTLHEDPDLADRQAKNAAAVLRVNQGVLQNYLVGIEGLLKS